MTTSVPTQTVGEPSERLFAEHTSPRLPEETADGCGIESGDGCEGVA
jgi:hypothetical protein